MYLEILIALALFSGLSAQAEKTKHVPTKSKDKFLFPLLHSN